MALGRTTICFLTIIFSSFGFISNGFSAAEIFCPKTVTVEEGGTTVVSCNTTGKKIILAFWYTGNPATTIPILRLENGIPGGTEYGKGHYNITGDGAMLIKNATFTHEALYTTLMHFQDETDVSKHIVVNITISPSSLCPVINVCKSCGECNFSANDTGKLTCSISEVRPVIPLKWIIKSQHGISIVEHPPSITKGVAPNTWNSSAEISFSFSSCNQGAILQCVSQDNLNLLRQSTSSVTIYAANCTEDNSISTTSATVNTVVPLSVCFVVIAIVVLSIYMFVSRRRNNEVEQLILDLKTEYNANCLLNPSPWPELVAVADTYTSCLCNVTNTKGDISFSSVTEKILKSNLINDEGRVLIRGRPSYGNSMFTKLFVQQWIQNSDNDFLLLFIKKSELEASKKLVDYFNEKSPRCNDSLAKAMESMKCILLIDELSSILPKQKETSKTENQKFPSEGGNNRTYFQHFVNLTLPSIFYILENSDHPKTQIWVTSCEEKTGNAIFTSPHTTVHVSHVDEQQFDEFIERVCKQFIRTDGGNLSGKNTTKETVYTTQSATGATNFSNENKLKSTKSRAHQGINLQGSGVSTETFKGEKGEQLKLLPIEINHTSEIEKKMLHRVQECLKQHNIYQKFRNTPVLLSFIVYTVVHNDFFHTGDSNDVKTTTCELIYNVMKHIEDTYSVQHSRKKFSDICKSLRRLTAELIHKQSDFVAEETPVLSDCLNDLNLALQIGLIERSSKKPCSDQSKCKTGSSSSYVLMYPSNYLRWYFEANYVSTNNQFGERILQKYKMSENYRVLKFVILLENSSMKHMFGRGFKLDDFIIDYIYKWGNKDKVEALIKSFSADKVEVTNLSFKDRKHREAFESFCRICSDLQVSWQSLSVRNTVYFPSLKSLEFQICKELTLSELEIGEKALFAFLEWLATRDIVFRLLECTVPENLSAEFKTKIETIPEIKVTTIKQNAKDEKSISVLDYKTGNWKMGTSVDK